MNIQVEILQFLHYNPSSSRVEIAAGLSEAPNERTLKRIIAECVQDGDIVVEGKGKETRYSLSAQAHLMMPLNIETYFVNEVDERKVQESFNFQLIRDLLPKVTLFTAEEASRLESAHKISWQICLRYLTLNTSRRWNASVLTCHGSLRK